MRRTPQQYVDDYPVARLREHPRNPNRGDVAAISESIAHNGFYGVIVVQRSTGYVLAGNHRLRAALAAGAESVPVMLVDIDDAAAIKLILADNRTRDLAEYDSDALSSILAELSGDLGGTGWSDEAVSDLLGGASEEAGQEEGVGGGGSPVIHYDIVFSDEGQLARWYELLKTLKTKYGDSGTHADRVMAWVSDSGVMDGE